MAVALLVGTHLLFVVLGAAVYLARQGAIHLERRCALTGSTVRLVLRALIALYLVAMLLASGELAASPSVRIPWFVSFSWFTLVPGAGYLFGILIHRRLRKQVGSAARPG